MKKFIIIVTLLISVMAFANSKPTKKVPSIYFSAVSVICNDLCK